MAACSMPHVHDAEAVPTLCTSDAVIAIAPLIALQSRPHHWLAAWKMHLTSALKEPAPVQHQVWLPIVTGSSSTFKLVTAHHPPSMDEPAISKKDKMENNDRNTGWSAANDRPIMPMKYALHRECAAITANRISLNKAMNQTIS